MAARPKPPRRSPQDAFTPDPSFDLTTPIGRGLHTKALRYILSQDKWPRRLRVSSNRYVIHRVKRTRVLPHGTLGFTLVRTDGGEYGMGYPLVNSVLVAAQRELRKNRMSRLVEVKFLIAFHCGAWPYGLPVRLLRTVEDAALYAMAGRDKPRRRARS